MEESTARVMMISPYWKELNQVRYETTFAAMIKPK